MVIDSETKDGNHERWDLEPLGKSVADCVPPV